MDKRALLLDWLKQYEVVPADPTPPTELAGLVKRAGDKTLEALVGSLPDTDVDRMVGMPTFDYAAIDQVLSLHLR